MSLQMARGKASTEHMVTSSILTLRNMQLKVVGREFIQPLLQFRGFGWFRFRLWCLTRRSKAIICVFVLENAVDAGGYLSLSRTVLACLSHSCAEQGQRDRKSSPPRILAPSPPYRTEAPGQPSSQTQPNEETKSSLHNPKPHPLLGPGLRFPIEFKVNFQ